MAEAAQSTAPGGTSVRVRLAELAAQTALATPGVAGLDAGPAGLHATVGGGTRVAGVTSAAAPHGGFDISLRLVCELVALPALGDRIRREITSAAGSAGLGVESVSIEIVNVVDPTDP
jgi:hypothetical protein